MIQKALVCAVLVSLSCTAQNKTKAAPIQKYLATITQTDLKKHLTIVASDEMEGRDTGTEGQKKAAETSPFSNQIVFADRVINKNTIGSAFP